jgi:hypothetical protein
MLIAKVTRSLGGWLLSKVLVSLGSIRDYGEMDWKAWDKSTLKSATR